MYIPTIISSFLVSQKRFGFHRLLRLLHRCAGPRGMADGARLTAADAKREDPGGTFRENKGSNLVINPSERLSWLVLWICLDCPWKTPVFIVVKKVVKNSGSWCFFWDIWLVLTGTMEFGLTFPSYWEWNVIIPTDFQSIIFQRGRSTTNQLYKQLW